MATPIEAVEHGRPIDLVRWTGLLALMGLWPATNDIDLGRSSNVFAMMSIGDARAIGLLGGSRSNSQETSGLAVFQA